MLCPTLWHANAPFNSCHRLSGVSGALTSKLMLSSNHINRTTRNNSYWRCTGLRRLLRYRTCRERRKSHFRHLLICSDSRASTKPKKPLSITPKYLLENFAQITQIYSYLTQLTFYERQRDTTHGKSSLNRQHAPPYSISSHSYRPHTGSMTLTR